MCMRLILTVAAILSIQIRSEQMPKSCASHSIRWEEVITRAVQLAKSAAKRRNGVQVALDIGPIGELLEPNGYLPFEEAYELYRQQVVAGEQAGADLVIFETMSDLYEVKAAILAAKEHTQLPVFVTMSFEADHRTFTGCTTASFAYVQRGWERMPLESTALLDRIRYFRLLRSLQR